jgi:DNA replication protein DnaC
MNERLENALRKLRLSGLSQTLNGRLEEAAKNQLTHAEFLELILQDELAVRGERLVQRRTKMAAFRDVKTLDQFDFSFNPSINKRQIYELATCRFIRQANDVLWLGPPGVAT